MDGVLAMDVPRRIEVNAKTELVLTWEDGTTSVVSAVAAREGCSCAACLTEDRGPLRLVNLGTTIESASLVGAYALNLVFGPDGHSTGIFDWATLRALGDAQASNEGTRRHRP
jgi:DUF971 family protein